MLSLSPPLSPFLLYLLLWAVLGVIGTLWTVKLCGVRVTVCVAVVGAGIICVGVGVPRLWDCACECSGVLVLFWLCVQVGIECVGCQLVLSLSLESGFDIRSSGVLGVCFRLRRLGRYSVGELGCVILR